MTTAKRLHLTVLATLAPVADAFAAGAPREDTSGLFVWTFLGLCALIVAAQVIPAILMAVGMARGAAEGLKERHAATADETVPTR